MTDDYAGDISTSGNLAIDGRVSGTLENGDDKDWFRLDLKKDHGYLFTLAAKNGKLPTLTIMDAAINWVVYTTDLYALNTNELVNPFIPDRDGQYYLIIEKGMPGAYEVGMRVAPDDASNEAALARTLTTEAPVAAVFNYAFDHDHFRVAAVAGMTYTITLSADGGNMGNAKFLRLSVDDVPFPVEWDKATTSHSFTAKTSGDYLITAEMASFDPPAAGGLAYHIGVSAADRSGPTVVQGAGTVDGAIVVTFDEPVQLGGNGTIEIRSGGGLTTTWAANDPRVHVSGNTLTLDPALKGALMPGKYDLVFRGGNVLDTHGNAGATTFHYAIDVKGTARGGVASSEYAFYGQVRGSDSTADAVVYYGARSEYTIKHVADGFQVARQSGSASVLSSIERVMFTNSNEVVALSLDGHLGQAFRLYTAAFDRAPDQTGLGYWLHTADRGVSLQEMARGFISSAEFVGLYGARPDDSAFVAALYKNVLHRAADAGGLLYWNDALAKGTDRGDVLAAFSESAENQAQAIELIGNGIVYTPYG